MSDKFSAGCLLVNVKRISLRDSFVERVKELYPSQHISSLKLMLIFRGRVHELATDKKDFNELNVKLRKKMKDEIVEDDNLRTNESRYSIKITDQVAVK